MNLPFSIERQLAGAIDQNDRLLKELAEVRAENDILHVGDYSIRSFGDDFWIEKKGGEGMEVLKVNFEKLIDGYFKSEF